MLSTVPNITKEKRLHVSPDERIHHLLHNTAKTSNLNLNQPVRIINGQTIPIPSTNKLHGKNSEEKKSKTKAYCLRTYLGI